MVYDAIKIRTIGKLFMKIETRGKDGSNRKLFRVLFSYFLPGLLIPFLLYKQNADYEGYSYAFLSYMFFSFIIAFTIIAEFDNLLISKTETDIFTSLPIADELMVRAKLFVLWRYIFITSIPLLLPGSVIYFMIIHSVIRAAAYFISGLMMFYFLVFMLLLVYSIAMRIIKSTRLSTYILIFQLLMIFLIIISYQFVSYSFTGKQIIKLGVSFDIMQSRDIIEYLPPGWFAFIPARHRVIPDIQFILKILLPFIIVYMSFQSLKLYLIENYSHIREKFLLSGIFYSNSVIDKGVLPNDEIKGTSFVISEAVYKLLSPLYLRNNIENSSFLFMQALFRGEKIVRLSILPMIIIPIGLAIFAFMTNQLQSPFYYNYIMIKPVYHISIFLSVLIVLNTGVLGIKVSNYSESTWIYDAYPLGARKRFINGMRKFFVVYMLVPVCVILFILFSFNMPAVDAILHTLYIFVCANLYNSVFHLFNKDLPLTKDNTILNSVQRVSSLLIPLVAGVLFIVLQVYVYREFLYTIITITAILTLTFWINLLGFHRDSA